MNQDHKEYSCLIFDLDGTLVDSLPDIIGTINYIIDRYGFEEKTDDFIRSCIGGGARNALVQCLKGSEDELIDREFLPLFLNHYTENCDQKSFAYPGVVETLEHYKEKGKSLAIATFKTRLATDKVLKALRLYDYFDIIVTADDVIDPKPNPECVETILTHYNCDKSKAILIGDTKTDYMTGVNAGIDVCSVNYGYGREAIRELNPQYIIDSMKQLKKVVL